MLFHVGVLIVFLGHLVGLLTPIQVFEALGIGHGFTQLMAIVVGGIAGAAALAGASLLAHRRLFDPRVRAHSSFSDNLVIVILWIQLALGLLTIPVSFGHLDGAEMVRLMAWAQGIFTFDPAAASYVTGVHPIFKLHLFLGLTIFVLFPFTRLVHMLSVPIRYLWRPGYQVVRSRPASRRPAGRRRSTPIGRRPPDEPEDRLPEDLRGARSSPSSPRVRCSAPRNSGFGEAGRRFGHEPLEHARLVFVERAEPAKAFEPVARILGPIFVEGGDRREP